MYRWFKVCRNGGKKAVWAKSKEHALERYMAYSQELHIYPGTTVVEITEEEANECWYKIA